MGLLDQPLISEMVQIEKKARKGDEEAMQQVYDWLSPQKRMHVDRYRRAGSLTLKDALARGGVLVCER